MSLAIVGCTVVDVLFRGIDRLPSWPKHTEFAASNLVVPTSAPLVTLGGNGANAAYVAAAAGTKVTLHTALADDDLGRLARGWLSDAGCEVKATRSPATALNVTAANAEHQRATFFYPGGATTLTKLQRSTEDLAACLVCGWPHPPIAAIAQVFRRLRKRGVLTAFDPGPLLGEPWTPVQLAPLLAELDVLLANEHELRMLTRAPNRQEAFRRFRQHFRGHFVLKAGRDGAFWLGPSANKARRFSAPRVRVVTTVGAGDSFNGAFLAAWCRHQDLPRAIAAGTRTASRVVASPHGVLGALPRFHKRR